MEWLINIFITSVCLFTLGLYFTYREKELQSVSQKKLDEARERYLSQIAERKAKEKLEIEKLKAIVVEVEKRHKEILENKSKEPQIVEVSAVSDDEKEAILTEARNRARIIEENAEEEAKEYLSEQKKEVQTKMVDLVMGVTKKMLGSALTYEDHLKLIEQALKDMEGEVRVAKDS
ncbi:TPA: hypothetical protein DDW69_00830 [candidate division CPR2 bacterium]|uniref:Uncharacterized protein n=1 Tax=candidate division CPR2 bacterium GW2011_GWC1_41_48 TaxID=1618344 RepID=A0A0G0W7A7_UNCC2|nr:MAG: hypothetical protein UT47_C0004G0029 [candidate division CPR2 bacterium GW2011_GWC2_39_35]KKR28083.1 MAG: hypothetical protein UT60_C0028G0018 [candidate division CPR2 bacterium GW2011_GWD2_39_7]KKS08879.1 MAG: hypothetical protein UU65_C0004G0090 [candidate division CPR2 bacterium GW2011_GWC1_41_48]OGB72178.1 MAG: hypothetical protein A2Y26_00690 [candidate division CPR2 bacterium GWD2_39_7]HBG81364.1 hypothetical protein [candidate division CPR2 bacterium]